MFPRDRDDAVIELAELDRDASVRGGSCAGVPDVFGTVTEVLAALSPRPGDDPWVAEVASALDRERGWGIPGDWRRPVLEVFQGQGRMFHATASANRESIRLHGLDWRRMILIQAIRNAMVNDLVVRNVADLAAVSTGKPRRPSKSLNLDQALAVLDAAKGERLWPYVAVSMLGGIRTEEARALRWSEVDLEAGTVAVYRSVRRTGETKSEKSRRVFQIPEIAVEALRDLVLKQAAARAKAETAWTENNLVFCTSLGSPMWPTDVRMEFKRITEKAGLGRNWTPRELRHTFVSLLSDSGVPIEQIADAVGHSSTRTTEVVYRHQLRPVTRTAAIALGPLFESRRTTNGDHS